VEAWPRFTIAVIAAIARDREEKPKPSDVDKPLLIPNDFLSSQWRAISIQPLACFRR
jgi:hypothetical protein